MELALVLSCLAHIRTLTSVVCSAPQLWSFKERRMERREARRTIVIECVSFNQRQTLVSALRLHSALSTQDLECTQHSVLSKSYALECTQH